MATISKAPQPVSCTALSTAGMAAPRAPSDGRSDPMAYLVEQAGGAATNGQQRIMDVVPGKLHERVSVVLGSKNEVERITAYHQQ